MTVTLTYTNGDTARLPHVQALRLVAAGQVMVQTFGNDSVLHSGVESIEVDPFAFG